MYSFMVLLYDFKDSNPPKDSKIDQYKEQSGDLHKQAMGIIHAISSQPLC